LVALCHEYHVLRLEVFGSAATDAFDPERSDVDLLVAFDHGAPIGALDQLIGFKRDTEKLLGRPVDVVGESGVRNRFFREAMNQTRTPLYAAESAEAS